MDKSFSEKLIELRIEKGLTQLEVAKELGLSKTGYAGYEQGRSEPNLQMLKRIANFYGVTADYLIGNEDW